MRSVRLVAAASPGGLLPSVAAAAAAATGVRLTGRHPCKRRRAGTFRLPGALMLAAGWQAALRELQGAAQAPTGAWRAGAAQAAARMVAAITHKRNVGTVCGE